MSPMHSEYSTLLDYLDWLAELPWNVSSTEQLSISLARKQLEEDHYGMDKARNHHEGLPRDYHAARA